MDHTYASSLVLDDSLLPNSEGAGNIGEQHARGLSDNSGSKGRSAENRSEMHCDGDRRNVRRERECGQTRYELLELINRCKQEALVNQEDAIERAIDARLVDNKTAVMLE